MYSTWFSPSPRGYCDRNLCLGCASGLYRGWPEIEECCDDGPLDGDLEFELGSVAGSASTAWGSGLLGGLKLDISDGGRVAGNDEREVLRGSPIPP